MRKVVVSNKQVREVDAMFDQILDCREGCLLDSYIGYAKGKLISVHERYETAWTSGYRLYIADTPDDEPKVWKRWEALCKLYDEEDPTQGDEIRTPWGGCVE